jgi:hypothetical protein
MGVGSDTPAVLVSWELHPLPDVHSVYTRYSNQIPSIVLYDLVKSALLRLNQVRYERCEVLHGSLDEVYRSTDSCI